MANVKFDEFTDLAGTQVPTDTVVGLDVSADENAFSTLNDLFSEVTRNITDGALRFGGFAAPAISAAGKAALYYDSSSNTLKLSNNAGAYANLLSGTVTVPQGGTGLTSLTAYAVLAGGTTSTGNVQQVSGVGTSGQVLTSNGAGALPTWQAAASGTIGGSIAANQVAVGSGVNTVAGSSALTFDTTTGAFTLGTSAVPGGLRFVGTGGNYINVASNSPSANRTLFLPDAAPATGNLLYISTGTTQSAWSTGLTWSSSAVLAISGTTNPGITVTGSAATESGITINQSVSGAAADAFHSFTTPSTTIVWRLTTAGFTPSGLVKANQLDTLGATGTVEMLWRLADASTRFVYGVNNVEAASINATSTLGLVLGVASTLTGRVRMYNSAGTTYSQISAGNAGSSLNFIWPVVNPTAGQVLSASAPSGSDVTLSWITPSSGSSLTSTQVGFGSGANALTGSADLTYVDSTGVFDLTKTLNSSVRYTVTNSNTGNAAQARFGASADTVGASLAAYSSTFTTSGLIIANTALLDLDSPVALIKAQTGGNLTIGLGNTSRVALTDSQLAVTTAPTTGAGFAVSAATVTTGNLVSFAASGTVAASNTKTCLAVSTSGANGTASQTTFGATISNTSTGTTNTNIALQLTASGAATANTALNVTSGQVVLPLGTVSLPSITPVGDNTSGIFWTTATNLSISVGATERFRFGSGGTLSLTGSLAVGTSIGGVDTFLTRAAAATWKLGLADAAAPPAQTLSVANVVAGTSNTAGATTKIIGSLGTSLGNPGRLHFQGGAALTASGSTQQTAIDRFIVGAQVVLVNNTVIPILNATVASNTSASGIISYTVEVFDGTDVQVETGEFIYTCINKGGAFSNNTITQPGASGAGVTTNYPVNKTTSGTLACTFAISAANPAVISVNANSSLTPSTAYPRITFTVKNLTQQAVAVQ